MSAKNRISDDLLSAYLDGEATPEERARVEKLLRENPQRRRELEQFKALSSALKELPRHEAPHDFADRVLRGAEKAFLLGRPPAGAEAIADPPQPIAARAKANGRAKQQNDASGAASSSKTTPDARGQSRWRGASWSIAIVAAALLVMFITPPVLEDGRPEHNRNVTRRPAEPPHAASPLSRDVPAGKSAGSGDKLADRPLPRNYRKNLSGPADADYAAKGSHFYYKKGVAGDSLGSLSAKKGAGRAGDRFEQQAPQQQVDGVAEGSRSAGTVVGGGAAAKSRAAGERFNNGASAPVSKLRQQEGASQRPVANQPASGGQSRLADSRDRSRLPGFHYDHRAKRNAADPTEREEAEKLMRRGSARAGAGSTVAEFGAKQPSIENELRYRVYATRKAQRDGDLDRVLAKNDLAPRAVALDDNAGKHAAYVRGTSRAKEGQAMRYVVVASAEQIRNVLTELERTPHLRAVQLAVRAPAQREVQFGAAPGKRPVPTNADAPAAPAPAADPAAPAADELAKQRRKIQPKNEQPEPRSGSEVDSRNKAKAEQAGGNRPGSKRYRNGLGQRQPQPSKPANGATEPSPGPAPQAEPAGGEASPKANLKTAGKPPTAKRSDAGKAAPTVSKSEPRAEVGAKRSNAQKSDAQKNNAQKNALQRNNDEKKDQADRWRIRQGESPAGNKAIVDISSGRKTGSDKRHDASGVILRENLAAAAGGPLWHEWAHGQPIAGWDAGELAQRLGQTTASAYARPTLGIVSSRRQSGQNKELAARGVKLYRLVIELETAPAVGAAAAPPAASVEASQQPAASNAAPADK